MLLVLAFSWNRKVFDLVKVWCTIITLIIFILAIVRYLLLVLSIILIHLMIVNTLLL